MSFNTKLIDLLKTDARLVDDEGELVIAAAQDCAWKMDFALVKLLLSDSVAKATFFKEIDGHWVFHVNDFIEYISQKNFLDNSYTRFKNRIGLTIGGKFLQERGEVALVWPYKDCVLEGGQTKEEESRKEIFFNEVLAQDEINRMLDPKVLTNFARYTKDGKKKLAELQRDEHGVLKENLIIKGNNLLALHTLKSQFRGRVKLIYIDPPYNTGNDSFGYNNKFNHSSWLVFMQNRISIAKELLADSGAMFIQCDDNEQAYLKILCDEIFGAHNFLNCIAVKMSEATGVKMTHAYRRFPKIKEYILLYKKGTFVFATIDKVRKNDWDNQYRLYLDGLSKDSRDKIRDIQIKEENDSADVAVVNDLLKDVRFVPIAQKINSLGIAAGDVASWKIENSWRISRTVASDSLRKVVKKISDVPTQRIAAGLSRDNVLFLYDTEANLDAGGSVRVVFADDHAGINPCDYWQDIKTTGIANEGGVILRQGKKPEKLLERIIKMASSAGDIVMDFHLGSGTTAAVAHKMGRQYIGVEQLHYGNNGSVTRLQGVIKGEQSGISKSAGWKGGGDFVYCELMKYNGAFMERIQAAKSSDELVQLCSIIAEDSFLNWYIDPKMPDEAVKHFAALGKEPGGFHKQQSLLAQLLDKNQLDVHLSEIDDRQFGVSEIDKKLNRSFYGDQYDV